MFVTNFSHISHAHVSESKRCFNVKSSTYCFHMKTKILADFQICISVPLKIIKSNFLRFAPMEFILNHFNEIFISHLEHFNISGNACPQHCIILRKITNIVFSTKKKISFKNLLSSNGPNIVPCSKTLILSCQSLHYVKHRNFT